MRNALKNAAILAIVSFGAWTIGVSDANAAELNCTSGNPCSGGTTYSGFTSAVGFAGALWSTTEIQPTGSGVIDSFVRIQSNKLIEQGMNTNYRPLNLGDENNTLTFTHDIQLKNMQTVNIRTASGSGGIQAYYQFLLDINQTGSDPLLSLDGLQICTSTVGSQYAAGTCDTASSVLKYNLDAGTNNYVLMNYLLNSGSGSGDLFFYLPASLLAGLSGDTYVYLWSKMGETVPFQNNDGYEEWAIRTANPVSPLPLNGAPEPTTLLLMGTGLLVGRRFLKRKAKGPQPPVV